MELKITTQIVQYGSTKKNKRISRRAGLGGLPARVLHWKTSREMKITRVRVRSSAGPYSVVAGVGVIGHAAREIAHLAHFSSLHIVSSPKVWRAAGKTVERGLRLSHRKTSHLFNDPECPEHLGPIKTMARPLCS